MRTLRRGGRCDPGHSLFAPGGDRLRNQVAGEKRQRAQGYECKSEESPAAHSVTLNGDRRASLSVPPPLVCGELLIFGHKSAIRHTQVYAAIMSEARRTEFNDQVFEDRAASQPKLPFS